MTSAALYEYGVGHRLSQIRAARNRTEAEQDLHACHDNGAGCYLVRRLIPEWEKVPDGE